MKQMEMQMLKRMVKLKKMDWQMVKLRTMDSPMTMEIGLEKKMEM